MPVNKRRAVCGVVSAVVAAAVLLAAPAHGERLTHVDARRDMFNTTEAPAVKDRTHRNMDLRKVVVRHRAHRLTIFAHMTALRVPPGRRGFVALKGFVRVNPAARCCEGGAYEYRVLFRRSAPHRPESMEVLDALHEESGCFVRGGSGNNRGFRAEVDYKRDVMVFSMPHRCLGNPKWARVTVASDMYRGGGGDFWDDDWRNPFDPFSLRTDANYSPRLRAG